MRHLFCVVVFGVFGGFVCVLLVSCGRFVHFCRECNACDQVLFHFVPVVVSHSDLRPACNSSPQFIFIANYFSIHPSLASVRIHFPVDSRCGDVLSFVCSPLLLFLHAGAVVTGLICEFSEGACLLAC